MISKRIYPTIYMCMCTSPIENFDHGYPHSNALVTFFLQKVSEENAVCSPYRNRLPATVT